VWLGTASACYHFVLYNFVEFREENKCPTFPVEDDPRPGPPERLVAGAGDDVTVLERRRCQSRCNEARHVCHVGHEDGPVSVGNFLEARIVEVTRVTADASNDKARFEEGGRDGEAVVVNEAASRIDLHKIKRNTFPSLLPMIMCCWRLNIGSGEMQGYGLPSICDENTRKIASDKCDRTITRRTRGAHDKCMCSSRSERQA
jgi:hypothetical protein